MLNGRLKTVYDMIENQAAVADIGTDHGYLPIALIKGNKCKTVFACDIKEKPLKTAEKNIRNSGVSGITTLLSDGLSNIDKNSVDTIVIAGMGGKTIAEILNRCDWIYNSKFTFIFQPMTSPEELRLFLMKKNFSFLDEIAVNDRGKAYSVFKVKYLNAENSYPEVFEYTGLLKPDSDAAREYINKQYNRICDLLKSFDNNKNRVEYIKYKRIKESIEDLRGK